MELWTIGREPNELYTFSLVGPLAFGPLGPLDNLIVGPVGRGAIGRLWPLDLGIY